MKKLLLTSLVLSLAIVTAPVAAKAGTGWTAYKPGLVTSAVARGETVLLGYLTSW